MIKDFVLGQVLYIFCAIVVVIYTLIIYVIGQNFWPEKIKASLIFDEHHQIRGSYLMAQHLKDTKYFKARPSNDHDCNIALYNDEFKKILIKKYDEIGLVHDVIMLTSSASKYDPFITIQEARSQAVTIAKARGISVEQIYKLIDKYGVYSYKPFFQLDIVNSSILNASISSVDRLY